MRHGVHFKVHHPHEAAHLDPLRRRLLDCRAGTAGVAKVVVSAESGRPEPGAWNVQVFHGLGDKGYTLNPIFLQRGWMPRARTAVNMAFARLGLRINMLRPPSRPGRRRSRYEQVNAYGPRFAERLEEMLRGADVTRFGHPALNEIGTIRPDPQGPVLWLPTWDNRKFMGGRPQSSLAPFAHEVALVSRHVPVRVKYHPLTLVHEQDALARQELEKEPGIEVVPPETDPYGLLQGVRGILTDTSSLGFEAYCLGLPVGLARPSGSRYEGLHAELAQRVPVLSSGRPDLLQWAESPKDSHDMAWIRDLLYDPSPRRNDAFADRLRQRAGLPPADDVPGGGLAARRHRVAQATAREAAPPSPNGPPARASGGPAPRAPAADGAVRHRGDGR